MNRQIKFRGKRVDNGEWVYGYIHYSNLGNNLKLCIQSLRYDEDKVCGTSSNAIDPNTVGQFVDFPGENYYEGDLFKATRKSWSGEDITIHNSELKYGNGSFRLNGYMINEFHTLEATGNIHNKE